MDGSITIDTKIDQKGFKTGVKGIANAFKSLGNVIKGIGKALVGVFVGGAIINSIKGILGQFDFLKSSIGDKIKPLSDAWETLKGTFVNFIATALVPMIPYLVMGVQWLTKMLSTAVQIIAALFGMKKTAGGIAENTKKTAKEARGALAAFDQINVLQQQDTGAGEDAPMLTPPPVEVTNEIFDKVQKVKQWFIDLWTGIKDGATAVWEWIKKVFGPIAKWIYENVLQPIWDWIKENPDKIGKFAVILGILAAALIAVAVAMWLVNAPAIVILLIIGLLIAAVIIFIDAWKKTENAAAIAFTAMRDTAAGFLGFFLNLFQGKMQIAFANALSTVYTLFVTTFTSIKAFVKDTINSIIGFLNGMISAIVTGINTLISGANVISGLAGVQPMEFITTPQIPRLAKGAVIPPNAEFAAILGDQTHGRNIEAPEDLIRQIIREEMAGTSGDVTVPFTIELDGEVIYKSVKRASTRHGKSLIAGGAA